MWPLPNPFDLFGDAIGEVTGWAWDKVIQGIYTWFANGLLMLMEWVWGVLDTATTPRLTEAWFTDGLIRPLAGISVGITIAMMLASAIQAGFGGRPELIIVDGANTVILDTRSVPSHRTKAWGSYIIHEWSGDGVVCFAAAPPASVSGMPERMEPDSAILDERTWYQPKRRVRKLIVDGQELTGKVSFNGGYNTTIAPTTGTLAAAAGQVEATVALFVTDNIITT